MLQLLNFDNPLYYILVVLISLVLVLVAIPSIIHVANHRFLFDDFDVERKTHSSGIARLGGVAIFCSFMITCMFIPQVAQYQGISLLFASSMILFVVGLKDDLWGVNPSTKFGMQFVVATIMVVLDNVRLTSLYGIFDLYDLPYFLSVILSVLILMFLINAFNLIDGIDGLAGMIGLVANTSLGIMFINMHQTGLAIIACSVAGACIGFLKFNISPAKIFMGDTGSLLLGFISAILCIKFIELNKVGELKDIYYSSAPSIAVGILIIPIFDALRVFTLRVLKNASPFQADRNHVHHRMLYIGFNHIQATLVLMSFNVFIIFITFVLRHVGNYTLFAVLFFICILFNTLLSFFIRSKDRKHYSIANLIR